MSEPKEVCVDASLAVKWVVKESYDEEAAALLEKWRIDKVELIAPAFFEVEVDSIIRKKVVSRKTLTASEGDIAFELLQHLSIKILNLPNQRQRAWELAKELDLPTIYDATYLALSFLRGCEFWTADEKLYNSVKNKLPFVKWLGEYKIDE
ncbi:type II toxin-antitoxin system VapC family toxin [Candidatus Poribacteria bacterium]|nr:type II toxin-antitoxin system VapC family toxin [Candidatus Poribacteria bacterium]